MKKVLIVTSQEHIETEVQIVLMLNKLLQKARCRNWGWMKKKGWDRLHSGKEAEENKEANEGSNQEKNEQGHSDWERQRFENEYTEADSTECSDDTLLNSQIILMSHILNVASARTGFKLFIYA